MRKFWNGIVAAMILSTGLLAGCATSGGSRGSGEYNLSQNETAEEGSIAQYRPVAFSEKNATKSKPVSTGSS